ncbi:MAG: tRNA dihydrouridine synthase DusB [Ignavibacteria bacterium]|jgi:tRNA-dihydrouridine synthase B|nr:tRNA dihydrouridine synthase DusB [Ignavibacteria bacterium]MDH7527671.1 tRNA dihydrouridine synthase DusB [Ignavibacteria bacterium]
MEFKLGNIVLNKPLMLAPMEDVTDPSFRIICKRLGADFVFTEFVNSEGLRRGNEKTRKKLKLFDEERPAGIQIYGSDIEAMVDAAKIAEEENPDVIDINAGCWVKNVVGHGAGAALLKDLDYLEKIVRAIVKSVSKPVTIKTRLGWDFDSIKIVEVAKLVEDSGVKMITIHCRTRSQAHKSEPDWSWIPKVKEVVSIPVILNGGVMTPEDAKRAFNETGCDGVMIARGAINNPFIFRQTKQFLETGFYDEISLEERIKILIDHLKLAVELKGERTGVIEFRKHYSGYLKGFYNSAKLRAELMQFYTLDEVVNHIYRYLEEERKHQTEKIL